MIFLEFWFKGGGGGGGGWKILGIKGGIVNGGSQKMQGVCKF